MATQDELTDFERWALKDYPECDISKLPSGEYRLTAMRDKHRAFMGALAMFRHRGSNTIGFNRVAEEIYTKGTP